MSNTDNDSDDDKVSELPDLREVAKAKEKDPMMFVSGFDADDDGIIPSENPDDPGERLLQAAEEGNVETITKLVQDNPDLISYKDVDGYTALHRACYEDNLKIAKILICYGAKVNALSNDSWTPLHSASHWNAFRCVRLLLENGANINAQTDGGLTPLHLACRGTKSARETIVILLTEPTIDVNTKNNANETAQQIAERNTQLYHLFEMHRESVTRI